MTLLSLRRIIVLTNTYLYIIEYNRRLVCDSSYVILYKYDLIVLMYYIIR